MVKYLSANAEDTRDTGSIPGWRDPLEKEMATHSIILAWESPWTEEPGGLQSMGSQKSQTRLSNQTTMTSIYIYLLMYLCIFYIYLIYFSILFLNRKKNVTKPNSTKNIFLAYFFFLLMFLLDTIVLVVWTNADWSIKYFTKMNKWIGWKTL